MESLKRVHFIGIGGIGMSALARWFFARNWAVSGSDIQDSDILKDLRKEGITVKIGHKRGNLPRSASLVIYNRAISPHNPELIEARRRGICVVSYAKALGDLTRMYSAIAITGSHGKSTTTAFAALVLKNLDPTVLIGTNLKEFGGKNIRIGSGDYLVLEADDFGGAFLEYSPAVAIITNIDKEHLDFYRNFSRLKNAFIRFAGRIVSGGTLIVNRDDKILASLRSRIASLARKNAVRVVWYSLRDPAAKKIARVMKVPGRHNASNARAAYALGKLFKIPEPKILRALGSYHGSWRRMEYRGELGIINNELRNARTIHNSQFTIHVYDDYAHHPTEIKATLQAFREKYPHSPLVCVFQPHQSERLKILFKEFQGAFDEADVTLILPTYRVPGRDYFLHLKSQISNLKSSYDSEALVRAMQKKHPKQKIFYLANPKNLKKAITSLLEGRRLSASRQRKSAVLVMMGAGDIVNLTNQLVSSRA